MLCFYKTFVDFFWVFIFDALEMGMKGRHLNSTLPVGERSIMCFEV